MRRKIVKQGNSALTLTLPSSWTKRFEIKPGDEVEVIDEKDFLKITSQKKGDKEIKRYSVKLSWLAAIEIAFGFYCAISFYFYLNGGKYLIGPFLGIYAAGFLFIGLLTLYQDLKLSH